MGSVTSRPKAPAPQVVYYNQPDPDPVPAVSPTSEEEAAKKAQKQEAVQQVRERNLLRRSRGSLGTIFTGFRGLLSESGGSRDGRKTLLGE